MGGKQPLGPGDLRKEIRKAAEDSGITKRVGWHTFRHSFGTLLVANGENIKVVQELMRHQNSRITMVMYAQALEHNKHAAQTKIAQMGLCPRNKKGRRRAVLNDLNVPRQHAPTRRNSLKGMAGTTGLEPAASAVTGQRSNQLNYVPGF
jgi:Phage integrase family